MNIRVGSCTLCVLLMSSGVLQAQSLPTSATIDAVPLTLTMPEHFQVVSTLEPIRRVLLVAPTDGVVRTIDAGLGTTVRETQQVAEIDRSEAGARVKIAMGELKEKQAQLDSQLVPDAVGKAQVEVAEARAELARLELDRLTLRAPFAGKIVAVPVSAGQFVLKGTVIAELADLTALKALVPVHRREVTVGGDLAVLVEEQEQTAKIQSIGPMPSTDEYKPLRELAAPFATAWVQVANPKGDLDPGLRVRSSSLPVTAIATVPKRSIKPVSPGADAMQVQVIRNEYVTNVPVRVLGTIGPERIQVTGALRASDALIASSSTPLLAGTLVRFGGGEAAPGVEGATPDPAHQGQSAAISAPGRPGSAPAAPRDRAPAPAGRGSRPAAAPVQRGGADPF